MGHNHLAVNNGVGEERVRGYHWRLTSETQLDQIYLNGDLVLYPIEADEREGWVRRWVVSASGNRLRARTVSYGLVEIVHASADDPFLE